MPQQPSATITGQIRLCGPRAFGDGMRRLGELVLLVANPALLLLLVALGALCVLLLTDPFLLFLVLDIALTHLFIFFCIQVSAWT